MWKSEKKSPRSTRGCKSPPYKTQEKIQPKQDRFLEDTSRSNQTIKLNTSVPEVACRVIPEKNASRWMNQYVINEIPKPCFQNDVAELTRRLDQIKMENNFKSQNTTPMLVEPLFDSGNSSPDDFSFNSHTFRTSTKLNAIQQRTEHLGNDIYPFGSIHLCLPKTNFTRISRCSSFNSEDSFCTSDNLTRFY